ncbi:glycosyltransferase family 4 protein [Bacillus sp. AFS033286]|uniref:glycosyltransferase family 4 protein n=1 Tax=Bacillus sp. AFS033286 TaxID=2033498 RepID=UPI000BFCCC7A|nr:glycosyltransferase family 4 protein [Bacillus sp. AFS033286]PGX10517.1 spore coat protein [Bacillus sp. AFS033286]
MKVLFITSGSQPMPATKGGAVETLVEGLLEQNETDKKFDFEVISIYDKKALEESYRYKNTKFIHVKHNQTIKKMSNLIATCIYKATKIRINTSGDYIMRIKRIIEKNHYDKIIIQNAAQLVVPVSKVTKAQIILHLHNDYLNESIKNCEEILEKCHRVFVVSEYIKKCVLTIKNSESQKIKVIKNCTDTERFNPSSHLSNERNQLRSKYGIKKDDTVLFFSGRLTKTKGVKELVESFSKIKEENVKLLISGSSWYGVNTKVRYVRELETLTKTLKDKIVFTGFVPYKEISKIHAIADIALVPSIWEEPAGLVVIEAMSSGLPLIITNSGGMPEYVTDECAIIVERDNNLIESLKKAIEELIRSEVKRKEMGLAGRTHVVEFFNKEQYYNDFCKYLFE